MNFNRGGLLLKRALVLKKIARTFLGRFRRFEKFSLPEAPQIAQRRRVELWRTKLLRRVARDALHDFFVLFLFDAFGTMHAIGALDDRGRVVYLQSFDGALQQVSRVDYFLSRLRASEGGLDAQGGVVLLRSFGTNSRSRCSFTSAAVIIIIVIVCAVVPAGACIDVGNFIPVISSSGAILSTTFLPAFRRAKLQLWIDAVVMHFRPKAQP